MKTGKWIIGVLVLASTCVANELSQKYEKAYFLETAKGQTEEALEIYRQIAATKITDKNRAVVTRTLKRMLTLYNLPGSPDQTPQEMQDHGFELLNIGQKLQAKTWFENGLKKLDEDYSKKYMSAVKTEQLTQLKTELLTQLIQLSAIEGNETEIKNYHERTILETDWAIADLFPPKFNNGTVYIPEGRFRGTKLDKELQNLTLFEGELIIKGADRNKCIMERSMNGSLLRVFNDSTAVFDSLTLKSQIADPEKQGCCIWIENGNATVTNCTIKALGDNDKSPYAVGIRGFSDAKFFNCHFMGYGGAFSIREKAKGQLTDCIIQGSGTGVIIGEDTKQLIVENCIITGTRTPISGSNKGSIAYIRNNLLIDNRGGIRPWLKKGEIHNNALINCEEGIDVGTFEHDLPKRVLISNNLVIGTPRKNLFAQGFLAAISVTGNIVCNEAGIPEDQRSYNAFPVDNTYWGGSHAFSSNVMAQTSIIISDPQFKDPDHGDFSPQNPDIISAGHGLTNPDSISKLWKKYKETCK